MQLDENYSLSQDANNVILTYRKEGEINKKTGKPIVTHSETYHKNIEDGLNAYLSKSLDANKEASEILVQIQVAKKAIQKALS